MSLYLKDIIDSLIPLNKNNNLYNKNIYKEIVKLEYTEIDNLISYLMKQTKMLELLNLTFSSYKVETANNNGKSSPSGLQPSVNCKSSPLGLQPSVNGKSSPSGLQPSVNCELIIKDFNKDDDNEWVCILQHNLGIIFLDILSHTSFINFINLNKQNRYLCIPVSLSPEFGNTKMGGHATCLIIDNALEEVYLFDPNGETNYFNYSKTYKIYRSNEYVNMLFNKYFEDLYYFYNIRYKFVKNTEYNPSLFVINRVFKENNNNNGNCMIISFLFPHYLLATQNTILNGIKVFSNLKNDELLELIKIYYVWFYDLMSTV